MKRFVLDGAGQVELADVDELSPAAAEAVVEVAAYSVNRGKTLLLERPPAGWRPGGGVGHYVTELAVASGAEVTAVSASPERGAALAALGAASAAFAYERPDVSRDGDLAALVRLTAAGRLHPRIGTELPWDRTPEVIEAIRGRRLRGNAVLTLS